MDRSQGAIVAYARWVIRWRWPVVALTLGLVAALAPGCARITFSNDYRVFFGAENPQLKARQWWTRYSLADKEISGPGAPYQFSETPWPMRPAENPEMQKQAILADIGWQTEPGKETPR